MKKIITTIEEMESVNDFLQYFDTKPSIDALAIFATAHNIDEEVYTKILCMYTIQLNQLVTHNTWDEGTLEHEYFEKYIQTDDGPQIMHINWFNNYVKGALGLSLDKFTYFYNVTYAKYIVEFKTELANKA